MITSVSTKPKDNKFMVLVEINNENFGGVLDAAFDSYAQASAVNLELTKYAKSGKDVPSKVLKKYGFITGRSL